MINVKSALNLMINFSGRSCTLSRPATNLTGTVKFAPSNYGRNLETSSSTVVFGREFVVTKDSLTAIGFTSLKRGDKIVDTELGTLTISEVRELTDIGGAIIGYRVRTS